MNALLVLLFAFVVRGVLIYLHPAIFGGDTVLRLANSDRVLLAYQLPLLQAAIYGITQLSSSTLAVRIFMAFTGALAAVGFYRLAADHAGGRAGLWAALLFASNPFLIQLSIVPYQEVPMLAALLFAFHFFFLGRTAAASVALGLACLTRYEAWAAVPVLAAAHYWRSGRRVSDALKAMALYGWAPLGWIVLHHGLSAPGTFVIEFPKSVMRLLRYVYLGWITAKNTPVPALLLGAWGAWQLWKTRLGKEANVRILLAFLALFAVALLLSAHGESPDPERYVTAREAHLFIAAVLFAAGFALRTEHRAAIPLACAGVVLGLYDAHRFTVRDTSQPAIRLSYELARYLDSAVGESEQAAILVKPLEKPLVRNYLDKIRNAGGEDALRRAREVLSGMDPSPPDCQRTRIHSALRGRLVSFAPAPFGEPRPQKTRPLDVRWIVIWSDHVPGDAIEEQLRDRAVASGPPVRVLTAGPLSAAVYRLAPEGSGAQAQR